MRKNYLDQWGPLIALLYGGLVIYYYATGLLSFLVNPMYNKLILLAGIILILLGFYWLKHHRTYQPGHCDDEGRNSGGILLALLLIPLVFGIVFKPKPLSSASALLRGISADLTMSEFNPAVFAKPTNERSLIEWVRILNLDPEPSHYEGQAVRLEGSIILDETLPENHFHLGRYLLTCCVADARVVALPVEYNPTTFTPFNDAWIQVEGYIKEGLINGNRQVVVDMESAKPIPIPDDAYELFE